MITDRDIMLDELAEEMFPRLLSLIGDKNIYDETIKKAIVEELVAGYDINYTDSKDLAYSFRYKLISILKKGGINV